MDMNRGEHECEQYVIGIFVYLFLIIVKNDFIS